MKYLLHLYYFVGLLAFPGLLPAQTSVALAHPRTMSAPLTATFTSQQTQEQLIQVLARLEEEYQVRFAFQPTEVENKIVSIPLTNTHPKPTLEDILTQILTPYKLRFQPSQVKDYYIIRKDEPQKEVKKVQSARPRIFPLDKLASSTLNTIAIRKNQLEKTITGQVTDLATGETLPGVNILVKGTTIGTVTDIAGNYRLTAPDDAETLVFSSVGYTSEEVAINGRSVIDLPMSPDIQSLSEVVVVGYGTVKKSDLTGSVASVKAEDIMATPTVRVDDALRGRVPGVQITPQSGAPGANTTIRIRGTNSVNAGNDPLIVIDGVISDGDLNAINTNDIESIEVLKDASALAVYGSRGANGVILITTKRGVGTQPRVTLDSYVGIQSIGRKLDLMNARQYAGYQNAIAQFNGSTQPFPDAASYGEGTDWQDEVFRDAPIQSHTLSFTGGNDKTNFYLSGNYFDQVGTYIGSSLKRYQLRFNIDHTVSDRIRIGNSLTLSRVNQENGESGLSNVLGFPPTLGVRDENGDYVLQTFTSEVPADNPVSVANQVLDERVANGIINNFYGEVDIIDGLTYRLSAGIDADFESSDRYLPSSLFSQQALMGSAQIQSNDFLSVQLEQLLTYEKTFGIHSINALAGYTRQTTERKQTAAEVRGFGTDQFTTNNLGAGVDRNSTTSDFVEDGFESFLFRVNYILKDKYLFTLTGRSDAFSAFSENNKWGFFPAAAVAWRAGNEPFIENLNIFSDLKIRASYGILGEPGIDPYSSLLRISNNGNQYILGTDQELVTGFAPTNLPNSDLKWETTTQLDIGIDMSFLDNRVQAVVDYYHKRTDDLLFTTQVPWVTGFSTILQNFGETSNQGIEFALTTVNIDAGDFLWETSFNISANRNEVTDIPNPEGFALVANGVTSYGAGNTAILQEGEPIGSFFGYRSDGIWNDQAEIDAAGLSGFNVFPGGRRFVDVSGPDGEPDGVIGPDDRTIIGNPNPDFFGGLNNTFIYKGFELSFFLQFVYGNEILNEADYFLNLAFDYNSYSDLVNYWTPENTNTNIPGIEGLLRTNTLASDMAIHDGSFLRLRNVNFSYNLPFQNISWIQNAKLYVSGTNLLLFDRYNGYDPEVNRGNDNNRVGNDNSSYPQNKVVTIGLRANF